MVTGGALAYSGGLYAMLGNFDRARELVDHALAVVEEFKVLNVYPTFERRDVEMLAGNFVGTEEWLRIATKKVGQLQEWWGLGFVLQASLAASGVNSEAIVLPPGEGSKSWATLEMLISIKRAGADIILTYFARDAAQWLR